MGRRGNGPRARCPSLPRRAAVRRRGRRGTRRRRTAARGRARTSRAVTPIATTTPRRSQRPVGRPPEQRLLGDGREHRERQRPGRVGRGNRGVRPPTSASTTAARPTASTSGGGPGPRRVGRGHARATPRGRRRRGARVAGEAPGRAERRQPEPGEQERRGAAHDGDQPCNGCVRSLPGVRGPGVHAFTSKVTAASTRGSNGAWSLATNSTCSRCSPGVRPVNGLRRARRHRDQLGRRASRAGGPRRVAGRSRSGRRSSHPADRPRAARCRRPLARRSSGLAIVSLAVLAGRTTAIGVVAPVSDGSPPSCEPPQAAITMPATASDVRTAAARADMPRALRRPASATLTRRPRTRRPPATPRPARWRRRRRTATSPRQLDRRGEVSRGEPSDVQPLGLAVGRRDHHEPRRERQLRALGVEGRDVELVRRPPSPGSR